MGCLFLAVVCFAHRLSRIFVHLGVYAYSPTKLQKNNEKMVGDKRKVDGCKNGTFVNR